MGFFFISSLVILYKDDYIHGDLNINRFILLVLMFVFLATDPEVRVRFPALPDFFSEN
jgi:hypothetical protein